MGPFLLHSLAMMRYGVEAGTGDKEQAPWSSSEGSKSLSVQPPSEAQRNPFL
jgi:hypothetical protein